VEKSIKEKKVQLELLFVPMGEFNIAGTILDINNGNPIPYSTVIIKGTRKSVSADANGKFEFKNIGAGKYVLLFSSVGYESKMQTVYTSGNGFANLTISLTMSTTSLSEIVVMGYGVQNMRRSMAYSTTKISANELLSEKLVTFSQGLQGKVAGLNISTSSGLYADARITLRGVSSLTGNSQPLLVVDGIITRIGSLSSIDPNNIAEVKTLTSEAATAIYGADGVNGAILVTTKNKTERTVFRDYAIWQPNFFTNKKGNASFETTYPDNVTGWSTYIVAMDKKRRIGKVNFITQAYKPLVAQLNYPTFLVEGDTSYFIGKSMNYTADKYSVETKFVLNGETKKTIQKDLAGNDSNIESLLVVPTSTDTVKANFSLKTTTGFKDGEERKIPVFKSGVEETIGNFWVLQNDTTVSFSALKESTALNIYAQNNTLDVLLNEIEHLKDYPYACMEQTASKLTGLALEKKIKEQLNLPFQNQKMMDMLLQKVQKAQLFDGGFPWWENGKANFYITNYVLKALLIHRDNPLVETNIRNGFLYLQNQLPTLAKPQLIAALYTLSNGNHQMDYGKWLAKFSFDSISMHQQWQYVRVKQLLKMTYKAELKKLIDKKTETILGGVYWGEDNYSWYSNDVATTVIAFKVLNDDEENKKFLPNIIQYFLEKRRRGYWVNTVESASILNTILPTILQSQKDFTKPASISISGDSTFTINKFPFSFNTANTSIKNMLITKTGGGLVFFTAYQKTFNTKPIAINKNFIISTSFTQNGKTITRIKSGERIKMVVTIDVLKEAEYVMMQTPIPAGCLFVNKTNYSNGNYREFFKNKVAMFSELLTIGKHTFEIELESRYNGTYTLNPTKVELMYYPTFFGRNDLRKMEIIAE
jgi:alpha-2-macroglobulin